MMLSRMNSLRVAALVAIAIALAGCESLNISAPGKKIDYKSTSTAPALEVPPDLTSPTFDDRYSVATASGQQARDASRGTSSQLLPTTPDAKVMRAGNERWLVVKATPEQAWSTTRQFWTDVGFVVAVEQPSIGVMETDWAENRADIPSDIVRKTVGKVIDIFYNTYKRDKFRTRIERGVEPGTMEIYISHRGMEQVPTTKIDNSSPAAFAWAVMPPNPDLEAEMLTRLMMRFGAPQQEAAAAVTAAASPNAPAKAVIEKDGDGVSKLMVDDSFDRAWRRVGLALDRTGFTVVDRDRSSGVYFVRYADPEASAKQTGWLDKLMFWKTDEKDRPEQYRIVVADAAPRSMVTVQDPKGTPEKSAASDRILALLRDQLR
jgi:outer membrane protein assembly factor BamC